MKFAASPFLLIVSLLPLLFSCSSTKRMPANVGINLPALPESVISLPIKIYAKPLFAKAETLAPLEFTSEQWPNYTQQGCDFRYRYRFVRSALKFRCVNNQVSISLTGSYQVAGSRSACLLGKQVSPWISGSCGFNNEPLRRVNITLSSALRFLPNYTLRSRSMVETIDPTDPCTVSFLQTDITGMVMNTVRSSMNTFATLLDRDIARLNIFPLIRSIETATGRKIPLGNYGYLALHLSSVKMGKINYATDTIYVTAAFSCYPQLSSDSTPPATKLPLPPLVNADLNSGFAVYANAAYNYAFINRLLTKAVQHKIFTLRKEKIQIDNLEMKELEKGAIELKAIFSGSKKGILYLTGTPTLDTTNQIISIPDLHFSLRSKSFVLNAGQSFFSKKILRAIRNQTTLHIHKLYQQNKPQLDKALTHRFSPTVSSTGKTELLTVRGMVIKKEGILLQVFLKGRASLNLDLQD